jgi:hypothetical protein
MTVAEVAATAIFLKRQEDSVEDANSAGGASMRKPGEPAQSVTVYVYTSTLATLVSGHRACCSHTMEWEEDRKHIKEVKHPRVIETGDRSP